jgi:hypothetical protein
MRIGATTATRSPRHRSCPLPAVIAAAHRPDLNQVRLELMVEQQAGIPILMKPRSGNSSDAYDCDAVVCTQVN